MSLRDRDATVGQGVGLESGGEGATPTKTLFLIRHGQSTFNKWRRQSLLTCKCFCSRWTSFDAPLTEHGQWQVSELRTRLDGLGVGGVQLIVTSPLVRAIDTALGVFAAELGKVSVVATHLHAERLDNACDIGKPLSELKQLYPTVDFSEITAEHWWYGGLENYENPYKDEPIEACRQRIAKFKEWLRSRREKKIAVIGHAGYFKAFLHTRRKLQNCEVLEVLFQ